jgi:hypothetical protein
VIYTIKQRVWTNQAGNICKMWIVYANNCPLREFYSEADAKLYVSFLLVKESEEKPYGTE